MEYVRSVNACLDYLMRMVLSVSFAGMIIVIFLQVFARNVLEIPLVWTLDAAQLLFSWCIFIGAGLALRWDTHFHLDLLPASWSKTGIVLKLLSHIGAVFVVLILLFNGSLFALLGFTRFAPAIGISEFWFFIPIPLGAAAMACFLLELIPNTIKQFIDFNREN